MDVEISGTLAPWGWTRSKFGLEVGEFF